MYRVWVHYQLLPSIISAFSAKSPINRTRALAWSLGEIVGSEEHYANVTLFRGP